MNQKWIFLNFKLKTIGFVCFFMVVIGSLNAQLLHPGLSHKKSDLDRIKYMVEAQVEPFYQSYIMLSSHAKSQHTYVVQGDTSMTVLYRDSPKTNLTAFESDSRAAYQNALMWYITGDSRHAEKAIEIFNAWTGLTYLQHNGTRALTSSLIYIMLEGAEIIKSTYNGWSASEINKFKDMLVYPGYSNTEVPADLTTEGTWYWRAYMFDYIRAGNQEISAVRACLAMGVFLDNEIMYDRALRYVSGLPHREDDLPYASGPHTRGSITGTTDYQISYNITTGDAIPDYGFNGVLTNYIWENGQSQESSRDLWHTWWGEYMLCNIGEIAWNQGTDFWGEADSRILLGLEFNNKYTVSYVQSYADQPDAWTPTAESGEFSQRMDATNRTKSLAISPIYGNDPTRVYRDRFNDVEAWELPTAHYVGRGLKTEEEVKWTLRAREKSIEMNGRYESIPGRENGSYLGYGGLIFRRADNCFGDPMNGFDENSLPNYAMNILPTTIEAENFDYFTTDGEDRTYSDTSLGNSGGVYRTDENVDIKTCTEGGYNITNIQNGEWLAYTVNVPTDGTYDVSIRYASANANGKIKFNIGGVDITTEVSVPFGASHSTGLNDWRDLTVATNVSLTKGVQALKVLFSGADQSFELNTISINTNSVPNPGQFQFLFESDGDFEGWSSFNNPDETMMTVSSGNLQATYPSTNGYFGIQHQADLEFSKDHPYLAIKIDHLPASRMSFYMASGWYDNNKSGFSNVVNETLNNAGVYVYDLSINGPGFGSGATQIFAGETNYTDTNRLIFLIDDGNTSSTTNVVSNNIDWIKNFASLQEIAEYVGLTLGVDDLKQNLVSIYPNPVKTSFVITKSVGADVEIYNVLGKLLINSKIENNNQVMDVSAFVNGVYFVKINNKGKMITKKIIKE